MRQWLSQISSVLSPCVFFSLPNRSYWYFLHILMWCYSKKLYSWILKKKVKISVQNTSRMVKSKHVNVRTSVKATTTLPKIVQINFYRTWLFNQKFAIVLGQSIQEKQRNVGKKLSSVAFLFASSHLPSSHSL